MNDDLNSLKAAAEAAVAATSPALTQHWTPELVRFLGISILVFSVVVLSIAAYLLRHQGTDTFIVLKVVGIVLIVCMSAFLMVVGYGQEQLTPIVGLFGAIAGYLLGREKKDG